MTITILTAIWHRHEIFKLFARGVEELQAAFPGHKFRVVVAGSEQHKSHNLVASYGFDYIEIANSPLSKKMQSTADFASRLDHDYFLCMGSDDIISPKLMEVYLEQMRLGVDYIGCLDWYFYNMADGRSSYWGGYREAYRVGKLCGAGRALSKSLLNKLNYLIWDSHDDLLDTSMQYKLNSLKIQNDPFTEHSILLKDHGLFALDIKSEQNMTPFKLWDNTQYIDSEIIKAQFPYLCP